METAEKSIRALLNGVDIQSEIERIINQYGDAETRRYRIQILTNKLLEEGFKKGVEFAQQWIPVGEELPKIVDGRYSKNVLICDDPQDEDDVKICYLIRSHSGVSFFVNHERPAYWRPIQYK